MILGGEVVQGACVQYVCIYIYRQWWTKRRVGGEWEEGLYVHGTAGKESTTLYHSLYVVYRRSRSLWKQDVYGVHIVQECEEVARCVYEACFFAADTSNTETTQ